MSELPHYEVHDMGRGSFMLMVHGFLSSRAQWMPNLAPLSEFCRPVVLELLAHGRSPAPEDERAYEVATYIGAFETIRERLKAERWIVCGQSFAAGLVVQYALAHRQRVRGMVLTNSLSAFSPKGELARQSQQADRAKAVRERGYEGLESFRIHPKHAKRLPADVKAELVADAAMISLPGILRSFAVTSPNLSVVDRLGEITVPTLLVSGRWEKRFQPMRDVAAAGIPGVEVVDLDGGHSINLEAVDAFNATVQQFVARLPE